MLCIYPSFQMEEEEHTDRKQQLAMLYQKLNKIKKYLNEGNYMPSSLVTVRSIYISVHMSILHKVIMTPCARYR